MTVLKEPISVRPASQHRHSSSILTGSLPKNRPHSHSLSLGSIHPAHRMTRRKSMSSTAAANVAAMQAAHKGASGAPLEGSAHTAGRRPSKTASAFRGPALSNAPAMATSVPSHGSAFGPGSYAAKAEQAVTDGPPLATMAEGERGSSKSRARRASEGSRLAKGDGKRAGGSELKCEKCGKGYKHSSCLTKHLWEHTPQWQVTSKLLISKHQQVQLLEAAAVLVKFKTMDGVPEDSAIESDRSSASPPASGGSDLHDELSSNDTTPPPQLGDHMDDYAPSHYGQRPYKRYSGNSSSVAYSQSYQSNDVFSDNGHNGHFRQWSNASDRPTTSGTSVSSFEYQDDENDPESLAAAVGLLSCSYGTPKSGPVMLSPEIPPVPPLPPKFMGFNNPPTLSGSNMVTAQQSSLRGSSSYQYNRKSSQDVDMDAGNFADDDEDGVFGRMEE